MRTYCIAQGTLLSALWRPKWEGNPKREDICICNAALLYSRNWHSSVKQLYSKKKKKINLLPKAIYRFSAVPIKMPGFPGGAVVGNPPANAGDTGSSPGLGGSHMPRSGWAREPQLLSLRVWSLCSATGEAATVRGPRTAMKSGPHLPRLEKVLAQKRRPNPAKNK